VSEDSQSNFRLRGSRDPKNPLAGCHVELHADGAVVLVVDGEKLFRFASLEDLLAHYELTQGDSLSRTQHENETELQAAEISAAAHVAAIHLRPRAEKALADDRLIVAIQRVRAARARVSEP
jgi:hypothetical protein